MARVFRVFLCAVFSASLTAAVIGCGGSAGTANRPTHSQEEIEKAQKLGKDIGINMMEKGKAPKKE
jgi:hypothetical protein